MTRSLLFSGFALALIAFAASRAAIALLRRGYRSGLRHGYRSGREQGFEAGYVAGRARTDEWWMGLNADADRAERKIREERWP